MKVKSWVPVLWGCHDVAVVRRVFLVAASRADGRRPGSSVCMSRLGFNRLDIEGSVAAAARP
jgi:hypothetical protein